MGFADDLAAAKEKPRERLDITVPLNGKKYKFRVTQMDGVEFAAETLRHPFRQDVALDKEYGYNLDTLTIAIAPKCMVRVEAGKEISMSREEWDDLFAALDGGGAMAFRDTVFTLNQFESAKAVRLLKKALGG